MAGVVISGMRAARHVKRLTITLGANPGIFQVRLNAVTTAQKLGRTSPMTSRNIIPCIQIRCMCSLSDSKVKVQVSDSNNGLSQDRKKELEKKFSDTDFQHFRIAHKEKTDADVGKILYDEREATLPHPIWSPEELHEIRITHKKPEGIVDNMAYYSVQLLRLCFDVFSGYKFGKRNEKTWLTRIIFLETVAGVPGMVAAMSRHLHSLRRLKRDHGWIHTLLEEAENERMHLMTALQVRQPGTLFRWAIIGTQAIFVSGFSVGYIISPRFCHRFVGYLEEEAVVTYSKCLQDFDRGYLKVWEKTTAPEVAIKYWNLPPDAMMRDVITVIRADEAHHRTVNHTLGSLKPHEDNPFKPGE
ncbi:alternative oxidase, mitochondrial-like [Glandiceps talaboti]